MKEKIHIGRVIVVEGRYDAARLAGLTDAVILQTDGFAIFRDRERQSLLKRLARKNGLLLLTDSDEAGFRIRTLVTQLAGEQNVLQVYTPAVKGKEPRKAEPGREGLLGVEGIPDAVLIPLLQEAAAADADGRAAAEAAGSRPAVNYTDLFRWGLSGSAGAARRKAAFLQALGLPPRLSKKELVEVLSRLYSRQELEAKLCALSDGEAGLTCETVQPASIFPDELD